MAQNSEDTNKAGTGFMSSVSRILSELAARGYSQNIIPKFDHFAVGALKIFPEDFVVDEIYRVEYTSDPNDQSILYAISACAKKIKGVYVDSYGLYHDDLSTDVLAKLCQHRYEIPLSGRKMVA